MHFDPINPRKYLALQNAIHFTEPIKAEMWPVPFVAPEGFHPSNVSFLELEDSYLICLRCVNYTINDDGSYSNVNIPGYETGVTVSRNFVIQFNKKMQDPRLICELRPTPSSHTKALVRGCEDIRLFECKDGVIGALSTRWDMGTVRPKMYHCQWKIDGTPIKCEYMDKTPDSTCEKNWLPWMVDNKPMILYATTPITTVFPLSDINAEINTIGPQGVDLRGSTSPLPWKDGWIYLIHEVAIRHGQKKRTYLHRFCLLSKEFKLTKISAPFYFDQKGIEYCAGAVLNPQGMYLGVSFNDANTKFASITNETIERLLANGPQL
jgi:hypothetical protein